MGDQLPFSNLGEGFSAASVTCGSETTCALSTAGKAKCWGSNNLGQLGIESDRAFLGSKPQDLGDNLPYVKEQQNILEIRAGYEHICAILADKSIKCWGQNQLGELGLGNSIPHGRAKDSMDLGLANPMIEPTSTKYKVHRIALGNAFTCAAYRLEKNLQLKLKCWGLNGSFGILGVGSPWATFGDHEDTMADNLPAVNLGMDDLSEIQSYKAHTCARDSHNRIKCWGANQYGTLGLGDSDPRGPSAQDMGSHLPFVDLGLPVKSLAQGFDADHTCAILINSQIKCWGNGIYGQLGYENDQLIGREPNEMGDNLPFVRLE
jgi:alpha-tubulin suppressor-like RCC1 family protein